MKTTKQSSTHSKFIKYLGVGASAFIVEYLMFLALNSAGQGLFISQTLSFVSGLMVSFTGNRKLTFAGKGTNYALSSSSQMGRYLLLALINLALTNLTIYIFVEGIGVHALFAKVLVMAAVVVWNFMIFSRIIFRRK